MKKRSIYFLTVFIFLSLKLFAVEARITDFEKTYVIDYASNADNSIVLLNTTKEEGWRSVVYAFFPQQNNNDYRIISIWNKSIIPGTVRDLIYSPYSDNFYFTVAWYDDENEENNYQGLYKVNTKYAKNPYQIQLEYKEMHTGIGYLLKNNKGIWLIRDVPQWNLDDTQKVPGYDYAWSFANIYQVEDDNGTFLMNIPKNAEQIKAMSYWRLENIPQDKGTLKSFGVELNFRVTDNTLLIKDINNSSWWNYNCITNSAVKYDTFEEAEHAANKFENKFSRKIYRREHHFYLNLFMVIITIVLISIYVLLLLTKKLNHRKREENSVKERNRMTFEIQEKERAKISRDIHDSVVQDIRVIRLETENLVVDEQSKAKQTKIEDIATDCIIKLRNICYNLTPAELTIHKNGESSKFELISIINSLVQQFSSRTHFPCIFKVEEGFEYPVLERETTQNLFRVIQEALTNIEKHSYATQASIFIKEEDNILYIYITDDGIGCNPEELQKKLNKKEHLGLRSMLDRMDLIGGSIEFFTAQDDGMEVKISLPLNAADNSESGK